ncbi:MULTISPECIES: type IV secretory system conjugative DNA transfer family protein [Haloferacaceae]|uniref:Type IV secretory system conjugative DNA transfer family protein n=1 Tax=Halorubrum glutamatedens TaxID=2707018 RepID=A0ABD5QN03_9EURY|nr:TraM recognition domain-containing protein [Halobellus captivus]
MDTEQVKTLVENSGDLRETFLGFQESSLGVEENIQVPDDSRFIHVLNVGPTGYGKTQLMIHAVLQDAEKDHGICVVNPKGGAIDEIIEKLPEDRLDDIVYINPGRDKVTPINVLEPHVTEDMTEAQMENQKEIIISDMIDLFRRYSENWGDRFGRVLETLLRAHIDLNIRHDQSNTLLDVFRCVVNEDALTDLIDETEDQVVREQLVRVKEDMSSYEMEPLQRRLNDFVMNPTVRRVIAADESGIDFRDAVNDGKIILVDIQKGEVGDMVAKLVGSIVITKVWAATQSRITMPEDEREPFMLYCDELQNFSGEGSNFTKILSEAREYQLGTWLATQFLHQMSSTMRRAVSNNCRTKIFFNPSGSEDLSRITNMLNGIDKATLKSLGKFRAAIQKPAEGQHHDAVIFDTYPPWESDNDRDLDKIKRDKTFPTATGGDHIVGQSLGQAANAGGDRHRELLLEAKEFLEETLEAQVNLLYQEQSDEKPDGIVMQNSSISNLEAEQSTLTRPVKVLRNVLRAAQQDRDVVFAVEQGKATKLKNIVMDPVNRRGEMHEDEQGSFSYYMDEEGEAFTDVEAVHEVGFRILEIGDNGAMWHDQDLDTNCPEIENNDREALKDFCLYRDEDGFCSQLEQPCVLQSG